MKEKSVGDYRVIKQMGQGSMGLVYLVEQRFTKKQYILKFLPEEMAQDRHFIARFENEVKRIALLEHPHLVSLHTVSLMEGRYSILSEDCVGKNGMREDLGEWLEKQNEKLNEETILSILRQVASALDYAHEKGNLVHGLLKFSNIVLGTGKELPHVKVADMGLSTIVGQYAVVGRSFKKVADELALNVTENVQGKEYYKPYQIEAQFLSKKSSSFLQNYAFLAPEQKQFQPATRASDVYAFGVLAYYLLTTTFPEGFFPMPSEIRPKMHFDFDSLIRKTLAFDPLKRNRELLPLLETLPLPMTFKVTEVREIEGATEPEKPVEGMKKNVGIHSSLSSIEKEATMPQAKKQIETPVATLSSPKEESYAEALKAMLHRDPLVTHYQPQKRKTDQIEPLHTEHVIIPAGHFMRGSSGGARDEMPQHQIYLKSFALDIHPVTNEQFVRFLEYMGGEKDDHYNDLIRLKESRLHRSAGLLSIESGYSKHPVVGVTWYGAVAYAQWVNKRLPTEAEWEVAACGGLEKATYPTGETMEKSQANFFSSDTTAVKSYPPNGYGLYDMAGNVYEWCQDWYGYNYYENSQVEPLNPPGPMQGVYRVLRGGCWKSLQEDLRTAHRHRNNPGTVNGTYGFRCASNI